MARLPRWSALVLLLMLPACAQRSRGGVQAVAMARDTQGAVRAPEFPTGLDWLNTDHPLTLASLRGKVVLLDFWTYCCINCMHVLPELKQLEHKYPAELAIVGVHSAKFAGEGLTQHIRQAILRYGIEHPVINDVGLKVWDAYAVHAWPTLVLIDPAGNVVASNAGETTFEVLDPILANLIKAAEQAGTLDRTPLTIKREDKPASLLAFPSKVLADGERLFIADSTHNRYLVAGLDGQVREVIGSGEEGFADGPFATAQFRKPQGLALLGDKLYLADTENHAVRVADLAQHTVSTLVGDGRKPAGRRAIASPWDVLALGGSLYVANAGTHQLWRVDPRTGAAAAFAGGGREDIYDGERPAAAMAQPSGLATDGTHLFSADSETSSLRQVDRGANGEVHTLIGQGLFIFGDVDGPRASARLQHPLGVAWAEGALYVADTYNNKVKRYDPATGRVTTFAGTGADGNADGPADKASFYQPGGLSYAGGKLYVADTNNHAIRVIDLKTGEVKTLALHLTAAPTPDDGNSVALPAATARPGRTLIKLALTVPDGYHWNAEGESRARLSGTGVSGAPADGVILKEGKAELWLTLAAGKTVLTVAVDGLVCDDGLQGKCYFDAGKFTVPLEVQAGGAGEVVVKGEMPKP